jgi:hypothetical protein
LPGWLSWCVWPGGLTRARRSGRPSLRSSGHRLGLLNPALYAIAAGSRYHDVTADNNSWDLSLFTGYQARRG